MVLGEKHGTNYLPCTIHNGLLPEDCHKDSLFPFLSLCHVHIFLSLCHVHIVFFINLLYI